MSRITIWRWIVLGSGAAVFLATSCISLADGNDGEDISRNALNVYATLRFWAMLLCLAGGMLWLGEETRRTRVVHVPVRREHVYVSATGLDPAPTTRLPEPAKPAEEKSEAEDPDVPRLPTPSTVKMLERMARRIVDDATAG